MKDFLKAIQILVKYSNEENPIHCEHDYLYFNIKWESINKIDKESLGVLGFFEDVEYGEGGIGSFKYGSC
tara:strand:- start:410 stop:619 length:210 start_codon:yes stop_codon:yes gene_type:complete